MPGCRMGSEVTAAGGCAFCVQLEGVLEEVCGLTVTMSRGDHRPARAVRNGAGRRWHRRLYTGMAEEVMLEDPRT